MSNTKKADKYPVVLIKRDDRTERAVAAARRKTCSICAEICITGLKILLSEKTGQSLETELSNFLHGESTSSLYSCKTCCDSLEKVVNLKCTILMLEREIANILNTLEKTVQFNSKEVNGKAEIIKTQRSKVTSRAVQAEVKDEEESNNEAKNSPEMQKWLQINGFESSGPDDVIMTEEEGDDLMMIKVEEILPELEIPADPTTPEVVTAQIIPIEFVDNCEESIGEVTIEAENAIHVVDTLQDDSELGRKSPPTISLHVDTSDDAPLKEDETRRHPTQRKSRVLADQLIRKTFHKNKNEQSDEDDQSNSSESDLQDDVEMDDDEDFEAISDHDEPSDDDDDSSSDIFDEKEEQPPVNKPTAGEQSSKNFSCKYCPKKYASKRGLRSHLRRLHPNIASSEPISGKQPNHSAQFQCTFCPKKYSYRYDLRRHLNRLHSDLASSEMINGKKEPINPAQFKCLFCPKKYCVRKYVRKHLKNRHSDIWNPDTHCPHCNDTFQEASALREHLKTHRGEVVTTSHASESTICDICGKQFKNLIGLVSHRSQVHPETVNRPPPTVTFPCPTCNSSFSTKPQLSLHINHVHENPGQFQCSNCTRKFDWPKYLKVHHRHCKGPSGTRRDPRRERNFRCDLCPSTFVVISSLQTHMKNLHNSDQAMKCPHHPECKKTFVLARALQEHVDEFHADFAERKLCKICNLEFPTVKEKILHHRRAHVLIRSANCTECDRVFTGESAVTLLNLHMSVHTGEKRFLCGTCGQSFSQPMALKFHTQIVCNPDKKEAQRVREMRAQKQKLYRERQRKCAKKCKICKKLFISEKTLKIHVDRVHSKKRRDLESGDESSQSE